MGLVVRSVELPNGVRLPYAEQGDLSRVPLLLLHGLADSWRSFERVLAQLPDSIHVLALTLRGHGDATKPASGYRSRDVAEDVRLFMDALRLDTATIVGASSGGLVAQRFAIDHPSRVAGLVLLGSPLTLRGKRQIKEAWESTLSTLEDPIDPGFARAFQAGSLAQPVPQDFFDARVEDALRAPARVWKEVIRGAMEDDFTGELEQIQAPTLIIWGDQDSVVTREDQEALVARIPISRLVVYSGAGHVFYWEVPERTAVDLAAFARSLERRGCVYTFR